MYLLDVYIHGVVILIGALLINVAATWLGLPSWYDFLPILRDNGIWQGIQQVGWLAAAYLLVGYPLLLGMLVGLAMRYDSAY